MTWSSRSAYFSSSRVALKASTRWWGSLRMKPTVSDRSTVQVSEISSVRVVVSRVSNSRLLAGMSCPGELVEEGGLARVGVAHDGHHRHLVLDAPLPLGGPDPTDLLQLLLQLWNLPADVPAVGLQLGLAGAAGADGRLPPEAVWRSRWVHMPSQPGEQVLILGQLHLEAALPGPCPLGEDVQNQGQPGPCTWTPQVLRQHPQLGGGQARCQTPPCRASMRPCQLPHLGHLALADEGAGVRGCPCSGAPRPRTRPLPFPAGRPAPPWMVSVAFSSADRL